MSTRERHLTGTDLSQLIAGPILETTAPKVKPPPGSCDCHAHIFGPSDKFPYADGRGYTPPDAPLELFLKMLDTIGCDRGVVVQGNAHGYDNRAILDAASRAPERLRAVCITDNTVTPEDLRHWHTLGVRGLRFHLHVPGDHPQYRRGVGLDVLNEFMPVMRELGWHAQTWCDWRIMSELADTMRGIAREIPVVVDHMLSIQAAQGVNDPNFQALVRLLGEGACWVKLSGSYRLSKNYPDYPDARPFHEALVNTNPDQLVWATDWPHVRPARPGAAAPDDPRSSVEIDRSVMPDDGHLMDLFFEWTPSAAIREKVLVHNPTKLYDFPPPTSKQS